MFEMAHLLAGTSLFLLAFSVLIFDIPRYTFSLISLALFGVRRRNDRGAAGNASVSVIIPTFNGGSGLAPSIASLRRQTLRPVEIIVVDDGSTDETRAVAERARALGLVDMVICHGTRCGRSAAINAAARFASGDLLLTVDADTVFEPTAVARLAAVFSDPRVAGASCNIAINNERDSLWTGLQSVEYLMSISAGRAMLDVVDAIACLSGACSMYRRDTFVRQGGLDVGPGEDLEYSLRLFHPFRAGRLGGNGRPDKRHKPFAPARALGSRCPANPFHDVWRNELLPSVRALAGHASETGLHFLRSCSHAQLAVLSGLHRAVVRRRCCSVSRRDLFPAALDLDFQHGAGVRHVQSIDRPLRSRSFADLSPVPGRLSEMRAVPFVLLGDHFRHVAA